MGLPLRLALAAEAVGTINEETWKKALQRHPNFPPILEAAKGQFLEKSMVRLSEMDETKFLCWLLERRHPDLFAKPGPDAVNNTTVNVSNTVAVGIPTDVLERARELARQESGVRGQGSEGKKADGH